LRRSLYGTLTYSVVSTAPAPAPLTPLTAGAAASGVPARAVPAPGETNPPSVSIFWDQAHHDTSPKTFTSWPLAPVYGTAQPTGSGDINRMEIYLDSTDSQHLDILSALNTTTWNWQTSQAQMSGLPAPSNGPHTLHVQVTAGTGGITGGTSDIWLPFTLNVPSTGHSGTPPALTVTSPAPGAPVSSAAFPMPVSVAGSASSATSTIKSVEVELDGDPASSTGAQPAGGSDWGAWTASLTVRAMGSHTITVTCTDAAGNSTSVPVTFVATLAPLIVVSVLKQRLLLAESYQLSSFLGRYGAGGVVKTFSLLPGESTTISVSTFTKVETTSKSASSILDSVSDESANEFEDTLAAEQHHEEAQKESYNYHVDGQASANWGWGSVQVNAGEKGGTDSSRDEFGKTTSNALQKHTTQASSKREVNITSEYTAASDTEGQTKVERQVKNVNVSRVLNFVFRQMNQELFTFLHLLDVRVAYYEEDLMSDGSVATVYQEAAIPEMDALLQRVIAPGSYMWQAPAPAGLGFQTGQIAKWLAAKQMILQECMYVSDYQENYQQVLELAQRTDPLQRSSSYWRVKPGLSQTYTDAESGQSFAVPGIIITADSIVMRTEGIIVDALLSQGQALDDYSQGLQAAAVAQRDLANTLAQAGIDKDELALSIVTNKDDAAAKIFARVYPPPEEEPELDVAIQDGSKTSGSQPATGAAPPPA
jgi:hypothetical protein